LLVAHNIMRTGLLEERPKNFIKQKSSITPTPAIRHVARWLYTVQTAVFAELGRTDHLLTKRAAARWQNWMLHRNRRVCVRHAAQIEKELFI